jgi:ankyrin repeat protein
MQLRGVSWWLTVAALLATVIVGAGGRGQAAGDDPLVAAARDGNIAAVRSLLAQRADANAAARDGSTALLFATIRAISTWRGR